MKKVCNVIAKCLVLLTLSWLTNSYRNLFYYTISWASCGLQWKQRAQKRDEMKFEYVKFNTNVTVGQMVCLFSLASSYLGRNEVSIEHLKTKETGQREIVVPVDGYCNCAYLWQTLTRIFFLFFLWCAFTAIHCAAPKKKHSLFWLGFCSCNLNFLGINHLRLACIKCDLLNGYLVRQWKFAKKKKWNKEPNIKWFVCVCVSPIQCHNKNNTNLNQCWCSRINKFQRKRKTTRDKR